MRVLPEIYEKKEGHGETQGWEEGGKGRESVVEKTWRKRSVQLTASVLPTDPPPNSNPHVPTDVALSVTIHSEPLVRKEGKE